MSIVDEKRGTPEGFTAKKSKESKKLKAAVVLSAALSVAPVQAEVREVKPNQQLDNNNRREYAEYNKTDRNIETTYDARVDFGVNPFTGARTADFTVTENQVEKRGNEEIKTKRSDVTRDMVQLNQEVIETNTTNTVEEVEHYANGQVKSEKSTIHGQRTETPSAINLIQGYDDTKTMFSTTENIDNYNRDGTIKESRIHASSSSNLGRASREDIYMKGDFEHDTRVRLTDYENKDDKVLYIGDGNNDTSYRAVIKENQETYDFTRNNTTYNVDVNAEGDITATKRTVNRDGEVTEEEMGALASEMMLGSMRRKADKAIRTVTDNEHSNVESYVNSVNAPEAENVSVSRDYEGPMPENYEETRAQTRAAAEQRFAEMSQVTAEGLLQQKMNAGKVLADKTGRGWQNKASQTQVSDLSREQTRTDAGLQQVAMQQRGAER